MSEPQAGEPMGTAAPVDLAQVVRELRAEVQRRRSAGEIPEELERELDRVFERFRRSGNGDDDPLRRAEHAAFIDVSPDLDSPSRGAAAAKRLVHRSVAFELRHVAEQVGEMGRALVDAVRGLDGRVRDLEDRVRKLEGRDDAGAGVEGGARAPGGGADAAP